MRILMKSFDKSLKISKSLKDKSGVVIIFAYSEDDTVVNGV